MIKCEICGKELKRFSGHTKTKHNLTVLEYFNKFTNYDIVGEYTNGKSARQICLDIKKKFEWACFLKKDILGFLKKNGVCARNTSDAIKVWNVSRGGPWNKGETKHTNSSVAKYADSRRGKNNPIFKMSPEKLQQNIETLIKNSFKSTVRISSLEKEIGKILSMLNFKYIKQYNIGTYFCDFYLPDINLVIETYGDFWHGNPYLYDDGFFHPVKKITVKEIHEKDFKRINFLEKEHNVIIIWESDIKKRKTQELIQYVHETIENYFNRKNSN